jgi:hypothetical protein
MLNNQTAHRMIKIYSSKDWKIFQKNRGYLKTIQTKILSQILLQKQVNHPSLNGINNSNFMDVFYNLPITSYEDWEGYILDQKSTLNPSICSHTKRYQPTSGSTQKVKWIPYNETFLNAINKAANVWMYDLYREFEGINKGKHYWSLSWLPEEYRQEMSNNDKELFSNIKQFLLKKIFPITDEQINTKTVEESLLATAAYLLICKDLSLISVWSPTFFLSILDIIFNEKYELIKFMNSINLHGFEKIIKVLNQENIHQHWSELNLISAWDTGPSKVYSEKLKTIFPNTNFQGKGLWTTEGVITIPNKDKYELAYSSHFYEFLELRTNTVKQSWELKLNDIVSPIITTQNGILRYKINDKLIVDGFNETIPQMTFISRMNSCDMVGEKLSSELSTSLLNEFQNFNPICLIGIEKPETLELPYYLLLLNIDNSFNTQGIEQQIENFLGQYYHYNLARSLKQLGRVKIIKDLNVTSIYERICMQKGMIKGNIKVESLISSKDDRILNEYF